MAEGECSESGLDDPHKVVSRLLNFTFQHLYNESTEWDWNHDDEILNLFRKAEDVIENESIIPKTVFEKIPDLKPGKFSILYDVLRLGIILYQSNALTHATMNKSSRASSFDFLPPEFTLLTTTKYHLINLDRSIGNETCINVLISHLKFERFLVAFFLKHTRSVNISFTSYMKGNCSELDMMFLMQIKYILHAFQHIDWHTLTTKSHLRKVLLRVQATRKLLISQIIKKYLFANETQIFEALFSYHRIMDDAVHFNLNQSFYAICLKSAIKPLSNVLAPSEHPETIVDVLNSSISRIMTPNPGISTDFVSHNYLLTMPLNCKISDKQAHQIVAKYAKSDTQNQSISPEDEQGTSFPALIDFMLQITPNPDTCISLLQLICSGKHPSLTNKLNQ